MKLHNLARVLASTGIWLAALTLGSACDLYFGNIDYEPEPVPPDVVPDPGICSPDVEGGVFDSFPLDLGPTVQAAVPPPPLSGGTLAISPDETMAVAADPDRDQVYLVEIDSGTLVATIPLGIGDEPGRVTVDSGGRAHVALRSGGGVATIDIAQKTLINRYSICSAPRGLTFDSVSGNVYVACHGGELVAMNPATGQVVSQQRLDTGLRDVVTDADHIYVSKFRTAEVLVLNRQGQETERMRPPGLDTLVFDERADPVAHFEPAVAWRMVARPGSGVVLLHQRGRDDPVSTGPGGYGGDPCSGGVVHTAITPLRPGITPVATQSRAFAVLPVDFALTSTGTQAVVVAAGNNANGEAFFPPVLRVRADEQPDIPGGCEPGDDFDAWDGQPIATAVTSANTTLIQFREPAQISIFRYGTTSAPTRVSLSNLSRRDTGHTLFHMNTGGNIACASCHPEGGDDSRVWDFNCLGPRRTQSLQFGLLGTEPFHWDGDMDSFDTLMNEVFVGRMGGGQPSTEQTNVMAAWLDTLQAPARPEPVDPAAVERGRLIFEDASVGCQACHSGAKLTNNTSVDVGTGGAFQVPSLINIADRAPFIHTGCAPTLRDRFTDPACGGGDSHGAVSNLSAAQIDDLVAYLETL